MTLRSWWRGPDPPSAEEHKRLAAALEAVDTFSTHSYLVQQAIKAMEQQRVETLAVDILTGLTEQEQSGRSDLERLVWLRAKLASLNQE